MARGDIKLESQKWLDIVFEGRNKQYGAYTIRQDSSNRHIKALIIVAILGCAAIFLPRVIQNVIRATQDAAKQEEAFKQTDFDTQADKQEEQKEEIMEIPKDIPLVLETKSVMYVEAEIVEDANIQKEKLAQAQQALENLDKLIGARTVEQGSDVLPGINLNQQAVQDIVDNKEEPDKIWEWVQVKPSYPGGEDARLKWLNENINYPTAAVDANIQGTVTVGFVVEKDGSISNVKILKGVHPLLDNEALRLVRNMPKWIPGKQNGNAVRAFFNQPIRFVLK